MILLFVGLGIGVLVGAGVTILLFASMKEGAEGHAPVYPPKPLRKGR